MQIDQGTAADRARAGSRSDADRQDAAFLTSDLRRPPGFDPRANRRYRETGQVRCIKPICELSTMNSSWLYVLDESTVGLHMADVEKLIRVLHRLVEAGNTVLVIEHNLDVIAEADWIIDLGPEGGHAGGRIVFQGPPEKARAGRGHTCQALSAFLAQRGTASA